ncbi:MAG: DUF1842 domain-containing protein [Cyanobacteria bacterium P01_F01_bin.150]
MTTVTATETVYLVSLKYTGEGLGSGSMTLQLAVDPSHNTLSGQADGTMLEGTQGPPKFKASVSGLMHSTGYDEITKIGSVNGQAIVVSAQPPLKGSYLAPFSASFAINNDWSGTGTFSVGSQTYECKVEKVQTA